MSRVALTLERDGFALVADLPLDDGVTGLLGANGSGKSTLLHAIAGVVRAEGTVEVGGDVLQGPGRWLPPEQRRVGLVFQDLRLFPHRSVRWNLAYGAREPVDALAARLGLTPLLDRRPDTLSGGERQKVALGRALAMAPRLVLLDEPFAALDPAARAELIPWVGQGIREAGVPALVVSHRLDELLALTDRLAVMDAGKVVATGTAAEVLGSEPVLARGHALHLDNVLGFDGLVVEGSAVRARVGDQTVVLPPGPPQAVVRRGTGQVRLRPEDVVLAVGEVGRTSARNQLAGRIVALLEVDGRQVARVDVGGVGLTVELTAAAVRDLELAVGCEVTALFKATALRW